MQGGEIHLELKQMPVPQEVRPPGFAAEQGTDPTQLITQRTKVAVGFVQSFSVLSVDHPSVDLAQENTLLDQLHAELDALNDTTTKQLQSESVATSAMGGEGVASEITPLYQQMGEHPSVEAVGKIREMLKEKYGLQGLNAHEDLRFVDLQQQILGSWIAVNPRPTANIYDRQSTDRLYYWKSQLKRQTLIARTQAQDQFQKSCPDDYARYLRYGVYINDHGIPDPPQDPAIKHIMAAVYDETYRRLDENRNQRNQVHTVIDDPWRYHGLDHMKRVVSEEIWDTFLRENPEKALVYRRQYKEINDAFIRLEHPQVVETTSSVSQVNENPKNATVDQADQDRRLKIVASDQEIHQTIQQQTTGEIRSMSDEDLDKRRRALTQRPILSSATLRDTVVGVSEQSTFAWVKTDKIVGMAQIRSGGWSSEIESRKGRVVQFAKEIISSGENGRNTEHIFHANKKNERIKMTVIVGPDGPIYLVNDGTHRVAGAMVAGLAEIPCDVDEIKYPINQTTPDAEEAQDWRRKIDLGLIDGQIDEYTSQNGVKMNRLSVRNEVIPWIRTRSQADLIKISRVYEQLYPGSLNKLKIPRDALVDPIANNYYMAGRWQEWENNFSSNSRDELGIVRY
ncbi:hypothetical protein HYW55_06340 [Candidatus Gottesmanbacteria bacterium]|nr:hypothetical protein [Candidatus Gottesmanbacteria bacterium]